MDNIKIFRSKKGGKWLEELPSVPFTDDADNRETNLIVIYDDITYQTIHGFGGALTEASAMVWSDMTAENRKKLMEYIFSEKGLNYNCVRNSIGACDFSRGQYSYCDEKDETLSGFSIAEDRKYTLPFIKQAQTAAGGKLTVMSSPWSPPAWMKTNGNMLRGGKLKREYYPVWADYFVKYINACETEGIAVDYVTPQNEPQATQTWESCVYSDEEEKIFVRDFLAPALKAAGLLSVKIAIWDHNKERAFERARHIFADEKARDAVSAIAFHWYSGDHFENLALCRQMFPEKELISSESCLGVNAMSADMAARAGGAAVKGENGVSPYEYGEFYAHDIIGGLNAGTNRYLDWNVILDRRGGPNHVGNFCCAPIICDTENQNILLQPAFYFISHFSRFITPGSKRAAFSKFSAELETTAFITKDGKRVAVIMNSSGKDIPFTFKASGAKKIADCTAEAKSIYTFIY
ncbi:MAG: glucosylceramidase [Clostridiales bacterium]|jgi:glucosylceramidase|nr:glucosylceramidase [Clostridiales bacterium]